MRALRAGAVMGVCLLLATGASARDDGRYAGSPLPSILVTHGGRDAGRCHSFMRAGKIEFLSDCTHALAGKTVDIPDWPYAEGEYGGV